MNSTKAIALLAVPFAVCGILLLAGMCLTPYWDCRVDLSVSFAQMWKPILFTLAISSIIAVIILYVDLLLISNFLSQSKTAPYRFLLVALLGGVVATVPRIVFGAISGQGLGALSPQVEFLPFAIAGAVFALALDRLVRLQKSKRS